MNIFEFNPLTTNVPHYIETSQSICIADQLSSFYMMGNIGCSLVKYSKILFLLMTRGLEQCRNYLQNWFKLYRTFFFALGFDLENVFTVQQKIESEKRKDSWIYSLG